ncbi:ATP-binding response regulator [Chondromyces apiculatus]|uniref:histidine kinase n=1 Tax=Chondromyces apiculatus DSM 436 TaxID=1192034 RepID=A0A017T3D2_9BACT|nr:response regulator [Chondromyces apiculatus]EYF03360.1 Hypothetical protein CAP_5692 [Chondromyces apiculatus DSM 436]
MSTASNPSGSGTRVSGVTAKTEDQVSILIVDDKPDKLLSLTIILEELGQHIVKAMSGRDALRHVLQQEFAVILLDINMPGMDGFETAGLIRQHRTSRHTPIIFVTAFGEEPNALKSYSIGAVDYILAPVDAEVLKTKVGVFVELFKKTAEVKRQAEALERRAAQLNKLANASIGINASLSLDATLRSITEAARDILEARQAVSVVTLGHPGERPRTAVSLTEDLASAYRGYRPALRTNRAPGAGLTRLHDVLYTRNRPIRLTEAELKDHPEWLPDEPMGPPLRGVLAAPLTEVTGRNMGFIQLSDKVNGEFTEDDEAILVQLAQLGSIAIQNGLNLEAREANRLKDEFLATLSHELRTPLNAILGWTRLLQTTPTDAAKLERGFEVIERNVNAQVRMIEDLLDISRITTGKMKLAVATVELQPLVEAVIDTLRPAAEARGVALRAEVDSCEIQGDVERLQQVFSNLLSNAIKFTPRGGRVDVGLSLGEGEVTLTIRDTGEGINPDFLPFVFERFRQADSTSKRAQGGLGIGLALVRHIVELHGGSVSADSAGQGQGSTFTVRLPSIPSTARSAVASVERPSEESEANLEGLYVLVVEDQADMREILGEVLRRQKAEVTAVATAQEALEAVTLRRPHVLVTDVGMPNEDGFELIRKLRSLGPKSGGDIPALALTGYARKEDHARALAAGFQMHASKPIEPAELVAAVACLAGGSDIVRALGRAPRYTGS